MPEDDYVVDPYTGTKTLVECLGEPPRDLFWRARGFFDPCQEFETEAELVAALSMRNGVFKQYKRLVCPYSNRVVKPERNERTDNWMARGVFYPGRAYASKEALIYALSTRMGRGPKDLPSEPPPRPKVAVKLIEPPPPDVCGDMGHVGDQAMEHIEELLEEQ
jgi:hypothetical protein